jgi:hypothetical protein
MDVRGRNAASVLWSTHPLLLLLCLLLCTPLQHLLLKLSCSGVALTLLVLGLHHALLHAA